MCHWSILNLQLWFFMEHCFMYTHEHTPCISQSLHLRFSTNSSSGIIISGSLYHCSKKSLQIFQASCAPLSPIYLELQGQQEIWEWRPHMRYNIKTLNLKKLLGANLRFCFHIRPKLQQVNYPYYIYN